MDESLAKAIEGNVAAFLIAMGRAGGADERRDAEIEWTVGGSPIGYHNAVVRCDTVAERAGVLIDDWTAELQRRKLPGSWHVSPFTKPDGLAELLLARGAVDGGDEPAMAADLAGIPPAAHGPGGLSIERVSDDAGIDAYRGVLAGGFGEGAREADWVAAVYRTIGFDDGTPWRHFVGRLLGEPVATVSVLLTGDVAGIYFVCTLPEVRQRGIGATITRHAMLEARGLGCTIAVLGASQMGYPVYTRLGFEEVFRYRMLEWPAGD